jgi:TraY domain
VYIHTEIWAEKAEMESGKPSRGRPRKPGQSRKRNFVTLRLRDETKAALMRAAEANQRSLSEELEARIETALTIFGGPRTQGLLRSLAAEVIRTWGPDDEWLTRWLDRRTTIRALKQRLDSEDSPERLMTELQDKIENCIVNSGLQEAQALAIGYYRLARKAFPDVADEDWTGLLCPIIELSPEELAAKASERGC